MIAVRVHGFGQPLSVEQVAPPLPEGGDVTVEVLAASVNPLDLWVCQGSVAGGNQKLPMVPGCEGVGMVGGRPHLVHGCGVGVTRDGLYAEYATVPRAALFELPAGIDPLQAATLGVAGATAVRLVDDIGGCRPDSTVLVLGASGGVGTVAVQLAKARGAYVIAHTSHVEKVGHLRQLGADRVVAAEAQELAEQADLACDVVLDPLGGQYSAAAATLVKPYGRHVVYGTSNSPMCEFPMRQFYRKSASLLTYSGTIEPPAVVSRAIGRAFEALAAGYFKVVFDRVLELSQAQLAHELIRSGQVVGKIVLTTSALPVPHKGQGGDIV